MTLFDEYDVITQYVEKNQNDAQGVVCVCVCARARNCAFLNIIR